MDRVINIYHKDWNGECILLNNDVIIRKDKRDEKGNYQINYNELIIKWDKWDQDIFYTYDKIQYGKYQNLNMQSFKYLIIKNHHHTKQYKKRRAPCGAPSFFNTLCQSLDWYRKCDTPTLSYF